MSLEKQNNRDSDLPDDKQLKMENVDSETKSYSPGYVDYRAKRNTSQVSSSIIAAKRNIVMRKIAVVKVQSFIRGCMGRKFYNLLKARRNEASENIQHKEKTWILLDREDPARTIVSAVDGEQVRGMVRWF